MATNEQSTKVNEYLKRSATAAEAMQRDVARIKRDVAAIRLVVVVMFALVVAIPLVLAAVGYIKLV